MVDTNRRNSIKWMLTSAAAAPLALRATTDTDEQLWARQTMHTSSVRIRLTNDRNVVTYHYSHDDGKTWIRNGLRMEVSGIRHNVFGGFLSLKLGIYSANEGSILVRDFNYRALEA